MNTPLSGSSMRALSSRTIILFAGALFFCFLLRFCTLGTLALFDPSEGRYATIAQTMLLSGDWITPTTFDKGAATPFLGKPPLQFWLTALSFKIFGMNEFASRLPSFCSTLLITLCVFTFATTFFSLSVAFTAVFILMSSIMAFFLSGSCMTDPLLSALIAVALTSFALAAANRWKRTMGYVFFASLGFGLLCKGPVAIVLVLGVLVPWLLLQQNRRELLALPWFGGMSLLFVIAAPWYLLAEWENPGFLRYFLINENFLRFVLKEYGDKYGSGHVHSYGFIWIIMTGAVFPWILLIPSAVNRAITTNGIKGAKRLFQSDNRWLLFALLWSIAPCLFFTPARQVSIAYVLPGLAGFAITLSVAITKLFGERSPAIARFTRWSQRGALFVSIALLAVGGIFWMQLSTVGITAGIVIIFAILSKWLEGTALASDPLANPSRLEFRDYSSQIVLAGTSIITLLTVTNITLQAPIDGFMSSKGVVEGAEVASDIEPEIVSFISKIPHSAYFYSREVPGDTMQLHIVDEAEDVTHGYLAATRKQWRRTPTQDQQHFNIEHLFGNYMLLSEH